jgi:hypothetical protein
MPHALGQVAGRLAGTVRDTSGKPAGAKVRLYIPGGSEPVAVTVTLADGFFLFANIRPAYYDLTVEAAGRRLETVRGVKVDPARETLLDPITVRPGEFSQTAGPVGAQQAGGAAPAFTATAVGDAFTLGLGSSGALMEIAREQEGANAENAEVATTLTPELVRGLPVLERDPVTLLRIQPGVHQLGVSGRNVPAQLVTIVNGQRASYANMTLDGVNIQENFVRINALGSDFNRLFLDQVSEFTMVTSNGDASLPGGSAHLVLVTPSGTNRAHGSLYYYHRNRALAAGNWLDNARGFRPEGFRSHQFGATLAGPVRKDRLLLYGNYEGHRMRASERAFRTLPTETIRRGVYSWLSVDGVVRRLNLVGAGLRIHPEIQKVLDALPAADRINYEFRGDSFGDVVLNTGGYAFPLRSDLARDSGLVRADWIGSEKHTLAVMYNQTRDDRDDPARYRAGYSPVPETRVDAPRRVFSTAWRWSPAAQWSNELRAGINRQISGLAGLNPTQRLLELPDDPNLPASPLFDNPVNPAAAEERRGRTSTVQSNAAWNHGRHGIRFGYQWSWVRSRFSDREGTTPTFALGTSAVPFGPGSLPGAAPDAIEAANLWTTVLAGLTSSLRGLYTLTPGGTYAIGEPLVRNLRNSSHAGYLHDTWRVRPRLSLSLGLRYDLFLPVDEGNGLSTLPELINGSVTETLLGDPLVSAAGKAAGRPWYRADRNNFNPHAGLAWDLFGSRSLVFRAGYSMYAVNDELFGSTLATVIYNPGSLPGYFVPYPANEQGATILSDNLRPPAADIRLPIRLSEIGSTVGLVDPNLRTPYVQQWSAGFQREVKGAVFEVRYTGNTSVKLHRALDLNQVRTTDPAFLADFRRAFDNGRLAAAATGVFDPAFNAAVPGSQPLGVMDRFRLNQTNLRQGIRRGEAAEFAAILGLAGILPLLPSRNAPNGALLLTNRGTSSYHGLQMEAVRRLHRGLVFHANYVLSKSLSDSQGLSSDRYEPYLDNQNPGLERSRTPFDLRHAAKLHLLWQPALARLAAGRSALLHRLAEGWTLGTILIAQSGNPFSIISQRGSFNISGSLTDADSRSLNNPASSPLNYRQLRDVVRFHYQPRGFSVIVDGVREASGRGAGEAADSPFPGQVFFNPQPGSIGGLQPRLFTGPRHVGMDLALSKSTRLAGGHTLEVRGEARNLTNTPRFSIQDQFINSPAFGHRGAAHELSERQVQLGLYYRF